ARFSGEAGLFVHRYGEGLAYSELPRNVRSVPIADIVTVAEKSPGELSGALIGEGARIDQIIFHFLR
ncbi:MAG: hypothetical protein WB463_00155, partial [Pseudolabrys sp.]